MSITGVAVWNGVEWIAASSPASPTYAEEVAADSPFAWWRLEETTGTTAVDEQGGHDGTFVGSPTLGVAGAVDLATTFLGSSSQRIECGTLGSFGSGLGSGFAVECWAKWTDTGVMSLGGTVKTSSTYLHLAANANVAGSASPGRVAGFYRSADGTGNRYIDSARSDLNDGEWHHIVLTFPGSGQANLYVDGVLDNGSDTTSGVVGSANLTVGFDWGARNNNGTRDRYFTGTLDECALYSADLSAARVAAHYDAGVAA